MKFGKIMGVGVAFGVMSVASIASAEEGAPAAAVSSEGHASGLMVQGRMQASGGLLSLGGGPSFMLGYQGPSYALALGVGLNRIGGTDPDGNSASLTLFQIMPTAIVDVWHSRDGRARANLIGGIGYGRGSVSGTSSTRECDFDQLGNEICTTSQEDFSTSAGFLPFMLGFGGDYYLSRNFALGAEVGLQAAILTGVNTSSGSSSRSIDASGNLQMAYGALRATFVLGD
jgi:hypothetical protein